MCEGGESETAQTEPRYRFKNSKIKMRRNRFEIARGGATGVYCVAALIRCRIAAY